MLLRDAVEPMAEHAQLGRHGRLHDQPLRLVDDLGEGRPLADEARVDPFHSAGLLAIDEDAVQAVEKFVARGAEDRPVIGQLLA